jgi:GT2 family glycosyltransferase
MGAEAMSRRVTAIMPLSLSRPSRALSRTRWIVRPDRPKNASNAATFRIAWGMNPGAVIQPDLSVVTVSFNTRDLMREVLTAAARHRGRLKIEHWVVDNASSDGTVAMIRREFPNVELLVSTENLGAGRARNLVIPSCRARYILNLDSDVMVHPGTMEALVDYLDQHPDVAAAGCQLLNADGTHQASTRYLRQVGPAIKRRIAGLTGRCDTEFKAPTSAVSVGWLVGAICIYRKAALEEVGLFDPRFYLYRDDLDLHTRLNLKGWKVAYVPTVSVTHLLARSADGNFAVARFDDEYGELLFTRKYGPPWLHWYRRLSLLGRGLYYARLCPDHKLRRKFWGKDPAVLRRVYRELVRLTLPIPGHRLAASSAPPAGFDHLPS